MSLLAVAKQASIATGMYRPVRWLERRVRPHRMSGLLDDIKFYQSLIPEGALCFDVGANIGEKSEALLEAGARVVSFEPNPVVLPELQARCGRYQDWNGVKSAVGSGSAIAKLHAAQSHGMSSLSGEWGGEIVATYDVPVVTLDSAIEYFGCPYFCKIDVEGWEIEVLKGLTQLLPLISFEFHITDSNNPKTIACLERLIQLGAGYVNVTPAESSEFLFQDWMPIADFLQSFPGDWVQLLPGYRYGDIFVKSDIA